MHTGSQRRQSARLLGCLFLLAAIGQIGCTENAADRLLLLAPELNPIMARHLVHDDEEAFARYSARTGIKELIDARLALRRVIEFDTPEAYTASVRALMPLIGRLSGQLAAQYGCFEFLNDDRFWMGLPATAAVELGRTEMRMNEVYLDPDLLLTDKSELLRQYLRRFREVGYWMGAVVAEFAVAEFMASLGNETERSRLLRSALEDARREDLTIMTAQVLGALGSLHREAGRIDSMAIAWNEAMLIATRHRLPEHAADIMSNYANYYASQGRLALAADRFAAAQEICREYKGGYLELRFILETMYFHAEYGHFEVVSQLIQRARVLHRESARSPRVVEHRVNGLRLDEMEARYLMSQGRVDEAETIFARLEREIRGLPNRYEYAQLLLAWSQGLLDNRRLTEALPVLGRGLVQSAVGSLPATRGRFLMLLARALRELGNPAAALQTLADFRRQASELGPGGERTLREEWVFHDACQAGIFLEQGNRAAARETLRAGLGRMRGYLAGADAGAQGYAFLNSCDVLRYAVHDYLADDPLAAYALELNWRRLPAVLGERARRDGPRAVRGMRVGAGPAAGNDVVSELLGLLDGPGAAGARARRTLERLVARGAIHLVYLTTPDAIVRWTAGGEGVRRDTLGIGPEDARQRIGRAMPLVSADPGDPDATAGAELARQLHILATSLLPPEVLLPSLGAQIRELLVSPDGFLGLLPFGAYNLNVGEPYRPLVDRFDIAYLRQAGLGSSPIAAGRGIIVADPQPPDPIRRRYPVLAGLEQTMQEAGTVIASLPGSAVLSREHATKSALFQFWEDAPFVYVAAHFIRDPELPYLTFLPLSQPSDTQAIEASYLDVDDIRSADLERTRLVVLSGCASGAPYVSAGKAAPGLGDALVDAGAAAVVDTYWRVRDDEATRLMQGFIEAWARQGATPEQALAAARRAYLEGPDGVRHPFTWGAYAVKLGRL